MARISFKIDGEIESFSDKATVKRIQYHKTSFTANVKQTYIVQKKKNRREKSTKSTPNNLENGNRNICINNYFKYKWFKCSAKRHRLAEWIQKQDPYICCLQETHFRPQDTYRLKVRGWKNIFHANEKQKKAGVAILTSDKINLKVKKFTRDKEEHNIMIKGSIQE